MVFAALVLGRSELIGRHVIAGAVLIVSGGVLIGAPVRIVAHLDLDAFFAAVEELEDPSLRRLPLIVGGDPRGRGVVATANYEAQLRDPLGDELRRGAPALPESRVRHAAAPALRRYSRAVWDAVRQVVPTVERTGLDEGYLDDGEVARDFLSPPCRRGRTGGGRGATSLTCSLGVASCKVVAKVASDRRKPEG